MGARKHAFRPVRAMLNWQKMEDDVEFVPLAHSGRQREDDVPLHGPVDNGINVDCRLLLLDKL